MKYDYRKLIGKIIKWNYKNNEACYLLIAIKSASFDDHNCFIDHYLLYDTDTKVQTLENQVVERSTSWLYLHKLFNEKGELQKTATWKPTGYAIATLEIINF